MIKKIAFTLYPVKDMARARKFYESDLGLKMTESYGGDAWIEYDLAGGCFAITKMVEGMAPSDSAGGSISFEVDNVDQAVAQLKAKGVPVKVEPFASPVCRMAFVLDPEGNAVGLHQITEK
jgi:predicted enzyme related to lactoylglutathione lyase